ncbi:MAG TPA: cupin domain-containing protein [Gemmatimonadaceae bacterium]|nr:cupin domain-containing protein [Gemmatimonadaceae bacterium]
MTRPALMLLTTLCACATAAPNPGAFLHEAEGERRLHRLPPGTLSNLTAPFVIKVDPKTTGSTDFFVLTEDIAPGQAIPAHRHPDAEEIIFIREGAGMATLAGRQSAVEAGAIVFMPRDTVFSMRNTGGAPLRIVAIFSRPGYEQYMREISVPEGEVPTPLTLEELTSIRRRHMAHAIYGER